MIGLPGDTLEKAVYTAKKIIELGAGNTRIYPCLVIRGTKLEAMYRRGQYKPLSLDEAVLWSKDLLKIFEAGNVEVIKLGLHPSEGLLSGEELIAGPFHPSFRELVLTEIWWEILEPLIKNKERKIDIYVPPDQINYAVGYYALNKKRLKYKEVKFIAHQNLKGRKFKVVNKKIF
jgi:histone acetyltransferase (RNA polymerase elongator complex component)